MIIFYSEMFLPKKKITHEKTAIVRVIVSNRFRQVSESVLVDCVFLLNG